MPVIWLTVLFSLLLVLTFVVLFVKEYARFDFGSSERTALQPLEDDETPVPSDRNAPSSARSTPQSPAAPRPRP